MSDLTCAISIATHNRLPELRRTLEVVSCLSPAPDELLICADGCNDGTAEFVKANNPAAKVLEHRKPAGSIKSRVELMKAARSDIVISLDDDSYPVSGDFIRTVSDLFSAMPHVAVLSFPQITDEFPETLANQDFGPSHYAGNYINAAAAFRRAVYLQLEDWPEEFEHAYDESDYTLQCLAAGYAVFHCTDTVIRHHFTWTARNEVRTHHRQARNEQWGAWRRCPFPEVLAVSAWRALSQLNYARKRGWHWMLREPRWWPMALRGLPAALRKRRPVSRRVYWQWLRLARHPIATAEEWQAIFGGGR